MCGSRAEDTHRQENVSQHPPFCVYIWYKFSHVLQTLYCNSLGCPVGYSPIADADVVACNGDPCEVSQCCEAFCSCYVCPDGYTSVVDAATTECDDDGCTTDLCCSDLGESPWPSLRVMYTK